MTAPIGPLDYGEAQQFLVEDSAHSLTSRGVIQLSGARVTEALQPLVTRSLQGFEDSGTSRALLTYMLDSAGAVFADLFVVVAKPPAAEDAIVLLDCARSQLSRILDLLAVPCEKYAVCPMDVSSDWRVFAELPSQTTFKHVGQYLKYRDPRQYMGARILRPSDDPQSSQWQSELHWVAHALRLGQLPSAEAFEHLDVEPQEANLHSNGVLPDSDCRPGKLVLKTAEPLDSIRRRVLPFRVEPLSSAFATMNGQSVLAAGVKIATVFMHHGLYGLALVEIEPWRSALHGGQVLQCAGETVQITWPSWLGQESSGRMGPVASASNLSDK